MVFGIAFHKGVAVYKSNINFAGSLDKVIEVKKKEEKKAKNKHKSDNLADLIERERTKYLETKFKVN